MLHTLSSLPSRRRVALLLALLAQPVGAWPASACPPADARAAGVRVTDEEGDRRLLLDCVRDDLAVGRWAEADRRLQAARQAAAVLPTAPRAAWSGLIDRLTAQRIIDAQAWADATPLAVGVAPSTPWVHEMVTAIADARLAWRTQDAPAFERLLAVAAALRAEGLATGDVEVQRAALLVQAAVAGGQYERDEMQVLLEDAHRLEQQLTSALGTSFIPIVVARELEADLWLQTDRFRQAAEVYRAVIEAHPRRVQSWWGLAEAYTRLGATTEAARVRDQARAMAPGVAPP